ncbi:TPA: formate dehydrogenase (NAD+) [Trebouxia sp. C0005]
MWHFVLTASTGRGAHSGADPLWRGFGRCHPEQADSTREQTEFECVPGLNDLLCQRTTPQKMPKQAMTPHTSGNNLDAQVRYQKGIQVMLSQWFNKKPFEEDKYIVREGKMAGQYS